MGTNAAQFNRELMDELEEVGPDRFIAFRADLVGDILSMAASRTPIGKTKKLVRSWGASFAPDRKGGWVFGSAGARSHLHRAKVGQRIWIGNNDFKASWFENGTVKMHPRPMLRPAIESVKDRRA